jgi:ribosomal protein L37AE/L43A
MSDPTPHISQPCPECGEECELRFREHRSGDFQRWECSECEWVGEPNGFVAALKMVNVVRSIFNLPEQNETR